jgi:hypothetical protein
VWAVADAGEGAAVAIAAPPAAPSARTRLFFVLTSRADAAPRQIASLCKCMTALVALGIVDAVDRAAADGGAALAAARAALPDGLSTRVRVSARAAAAQGTSAALAAGETATIWDLLHGLMLPSGNDAALALAEALGGLCAPPPADAWAPWAPAAHYDAPALTRDEPVSRFVEEMNKAARALGLTATRFVNPSGCARRRASRGTSECELPVTDPLLSLSPRSD